MTVVDEFVSTLREQLTRHIEWQPEYLLEHDGGPLALKADVILATLYGFDEQVDAEWRIPEVRDVLLRPLMQRMDWTQVDPDPVAAPTFRTAEYVLQSNWATTQVDWLRFRDMLPKDVRPPAGDFLVTVALVRYRRRR